MMKRKQEADACSLSGSWASCFNRRYANAFSEITRSLGLHRHCFCAWIIGHCCARWQSIFLRNTHRSNVLQFPYSRRTIDSYLIIIIVIIISSSISRVGMLNGSNWWRTTATHLKGTRTAGGVTSPLITSRSSRPHQQTFTAVSRHPWTVSINIF